MLWFLKKLLNSNDKDADSIVAGGLFAIIMMCAAQLLSIVLSKDHAFSAFQFGTGCAAIVTAIGGGKTIRDRWSPAGDPSIVLPDTAAPEAVADAAKQGQK